MKLLDMFCCSYCSLLQVLRISYPITGQAYVCEVQREATSWSWHRSLTIRLAVTTSGNRRQILLNLATKLKRLDKNYFVIINQVLQPSGYYMIWNVQIMKNNNFIITIGGEPTIQSLLWPAEDLLAHHVCLHYIAAPVGGASPHQVGHDQGRRATPAGRAVHEGRSRLVPVDALGHLVEVVYERGVGSIRHRDRQNLEQVQLRVRHLLQPTGVDDERDVPAGQDAAVQSCIQTAEVQTGAHLGHWHRPLLDTGLVSTLVLKRNTDYWFRTPVKASLEQIKNSYFFLLIDFH